MEYTCAHCGKRFKPQNPHHTYKYCSRECYRAWVNAKRKATVATLTEKEKETIFAMAENRLSCTRAAKELFYNPMTIRERCFRIRKKTGLDCREFYDVVKLLEMIKEGE